MPSYTSWSLTMFTMMFLVRPMGVRHFNKALAKKFLLWFGVYNIKQKVPSTKGPGISSFCNAMCDHKKKIFIFGQCFTLGIALGEGCSPTEAVLCYDSVLSSHFFILAIYSQKVVLKIKSTEIKCFLRFLSIRIRWKFKKFFLPDIYTWF